jgi:magnesium transporter
MDVLQICDGGVIRRDVDELPTLLKDEEALIWVDVPLCGQAEAELLRDVFRFHPLAVRDCVERNHVSKVHAYPDHVFTVLHAPKVGRRGHVHYVELDQFIGRNYLVTIHGPLSPAVDPDEAFIDTRSVRRRMENGSLLPRSPSDLSYAIVSSLTNRVADLVAQLAQESGRLEQRVMLSDELDDPEAFLEELFEVWYELLAIRTIAAHSAATYGRIAHLDRLLNEATRERVADIAEQFDLLKSLADGQREFLHGVIEFYQTRTSTHMTLAAEKTAETGVQQNDDMRKITAWVAIVAVPTAVTGFFGQNVPYPGFGERAGFIGSVVIMVAIAIALYVVFRRKKWL